jgi:parallel beta-helix repeat protein
MPHLSPQFEDTPIKRLCLRFADLILLIVAVCADACGGSDSSSGPTAGTLEVMTSTTGVDPDTDGYTVHIDAAPGQVLGPNGTLSVADLIPGNHVIRLAGVAANCTVMGDNPRSEGVTEGQTTTVTFLVTCGAIGLPLFPGQNIQALVDANPAGTTYLLKTGTHLQQSVIPKSGDRFIGEPGTMLDGQHTARYAFAKGVAPYPSNVTIKGLTITGYVPAFQRGAIDAGGYPPSEGTTGWVIDSNEVSFNAEYGIRIGNSTLITNNNVHHNERLNIGGSGNNTTIVSNEISFGNYLKINDTNFEAGGTKFTYTDGLVLRNNYVHDNVGAGLWMDLNNINTVIEGNQVELNGSEGIAIEISYKTAIFNNTVTNNGWSDPRSRYTWLWNAGIGIHASSEVEVYGNTVSDNYAGIAAIEQDRRKEPTNFGPHIVQNLDVHDNLITQTNVPRVTGELSVAAGIVTDIPGNTAIFVSRNNRFRGNTYSLGQNAAPFAWMNEILTPVGWNGFGQDVGSIFSRSAGLF